MLESINDQYDAIYDALTERRELHYIYAIDRDLLREVLGFLQHFKVASEKVCSEKKPTLHLVVPFQHRLPSSVCQESATDLTSHPTNESKWSGSSSK